MKFKVFKGYQGLGDLTTRYARYASIVFLVPITITSALAHEPFNAEELQWLKLKPIVYFSIHEKNAIHLRPGDGKESAGTYHQLLNQLQQHTQQQYLAVWRKGDDDGLKDISQGNVDFIIDPPYDWLLHHSASPFDSILAKTIHSPSVLPSATPLFIDKTVFIFSFTLVLISLALAYWIWNLKQLHRGQVGMVQNLVKQKS